MTHSQIALLADANFYRRCSDGRLANIRANEALKAVRVYAHPYTVLELIAHLADPADPDYLPARAAIRRLVAHCERRWEDGGLGLGICADPYQLLTKALFDKLPPNQAEGPELLADLCGRIAISTGHQDLAPIHDDLARIAAWVAMQEAEFVEHLWEAVVKAVLPNAASWGELERVPEVRAQVRAFAASDQALHSLAAGLIATTARGLGQAASYTPSNTDIEFVIDRFRTGLEFSNLLLLRILDEGLDLTIRKRGNMLWDRTLAFGVGSYHRLEDRPVLLLTDDRFVHSAAERAREASLVLSLERYESYLQSEAAA